MDKLVNIKYIDNRPIYISTLSAYRNGILPRRGETLKVTENEAKKLLKQLNGKKPCWELDKEKPKRKPKEEPIRTGYAVIQDQAETKE